MTDTNDANDADMERRDSAFKWLLILGVNACAATVALIGVRDPRSATGTGSPSSP